MENYYKIINLTKREYLIPEKFNNDGTFLHFYAQSYGVMSALAFLLGEGFAGGHHVLNVMAFFGHWAGDRITIAGFDIERGKYLKPQFKDETLFDMCDNKATDISVPVLKSMLDIPAFKDMFVNGYVSHKKTAIRQFSDVDNLLKPFMPAGSKVSQFQSMSGGATSQSTAQTFAVRGSTGKQYTVIRKSTGEWSCTCPGWIFKRHDCKHITQIKSTQPSLI